MSGVLFRYYYLVIFGFYFLNVFYESIRPGVLASAFIIMLSLTVVPSNATRLELLINLYVFYNIFGILLNFQNDIPLRIGFEEFSSSALPVMFFFIARRFGSQSEKFYQSFLFACFLCYGTGMFWYLELPPYYVEYLTRLQLRFSIDGYLLDKRFFSFLGSTSIGLFAPISALVAFYLLFVTRQFRYLAMALLSVVISLLSYHRASYVMILFVMIFVHIKFLKNRFSAIIVGWELVFLAAVVISLDSSGIGTLEDIRTVFVRLDSAVSSRSDQWLTVTRLGLRIVFGNGLGSMSHRAVEYSTALVNDGGYFKLLGELGLVGFGLFLLVLLATANIIFNKRCLGSVSLEACIILLFLIQSIGSNGLFFQDSAPLFWIAIGFISSREQVMCQGVVRSGWRRWPAGAALSK